MSVKVRCPSCNKLLNAPDAARGKAIKCPGCQTRIKVPVEGEGGSAGGKRAAKLAVAKKPAESGGSSGEFLANLDFSKAIDSSVSLCPRCGAEIPEEAAECPKCGVDPATGQLSAAAKRRATQKGPDPALFYSAAWKDSWAFVKNNMRIVMRTTLYGVLSYGLAAFCMFMVFWSSKLPPKAFWFALFVLAMQIFPGWLWHLNVETIKATIRRKDVLKGVNFDMFQNISLGIKTILWTSLCGWPPAFLTLPLSMVHMSMPVTKKAWAPWTMLLIFLRNFKPAMYWWLMRIALNSVLVASLAAFVVFYAMGLYQHVMSLEEGQKIPQATIWISTSIIATAGIVGLFVYSLTSLFEYRAMGLLGYYFQDTLDLVTFVEDKVYVRKEIPVDAFGNPLKSKKDKIVGVVVPIVVLIVLSISGFMVYRTLFPVRDVKLPIDEAEIAAPNEAAK